MSLFRSLIAQAKEISLKNELLAGTQDLKSIAAATVQPKNSVASEKLASLST